MNYYDLFNETNGEFNTWVKYMNNAYIENSAPTVKIFKLDKTATQLDELYGEESSARIYLPPFDMKMYHLTNPYKQMLGDGTMPYLETEEELTFVCNFDNMVTTIRDLRSIHTSEITLSYTGVNVISASNLDNIFIIKENSTVIFNADLTDTLYGTSVKLNTAINSLPNITATFSGKNDLSIDITDFNETKFNNQDLIFYTIDDTYRNLTDIIESGDLILTEKWKLYEVHTNMPGGDFGWDYATFVLQGNLRSLKDKASLPGDYANQIIRHEYSLRDRINME